MSTQKKKLIRKEMQQNQVYLKVYGRKIFDKHIRDIHCTTDIISSDYLKMCENSKCLETLIHNVDFLSY